MFKKLGLIGISLVVLSGCTAAVTDNIITQDESPTAVSDTMIAEWQAQFPNYQIKKLTLASTDGQATLVGLYFDNKASDDLIYYVAGNGMKLAEGGIDAMLSLAEYQQDMVIFDRRGLGASDGKADVTNLLADAKQQIAYVKQEIHPKHLLVHGYSLGSFVATQAIKDMSIDGLILQGVGTNVTDWVDARLPWYAFWPFVTVKISPDIGALDNTDVVKNYYHGPLLIIAGGEDEMVPPKLGEALYEDSQSTDKQFVLAEHADHGEMLDDAKVVAAYHHFVSVVERQ